MGSELELLDTAKALRVTNDAEYSQAVGLREAIRDGIAQVKASQDPLCEAADKAHKAATMERARLLAPWEEALKAVDRPILGYQQEQERARQALLESERVRVAQEQAALAAKAVEEEAKGNYEQAREAYLDMAGKQDTLHMVEKDLRATPKAPVAFRTNYSARVVDAKLVPREFLVVDKAKLNAWARTVKDEFSVPGCELVIERKVAGRCA